jgi:hypothetical protein
MLNNILVTIIARAQREDGHALPAVGSLIGAAGAIALAIGACDNRDWLTILGGIVLAVGIVAGGVLEHMGVDYGIFGRLEKLEKS